MDMIHRQMSKEDVGTHGMEHGPTALLTVDLAAIGENYRLLRSLGQGRECGAVVKANAYGLGVETVAPYLARQGCSTFFVATLAEGVQLRRLVARAKIYLLNGLPTGPLALFREYGLSPVLNSLAMLKRWLEISGATGDFPPAALHLDTGMNRLGIGSDEWEELQNELPHICESGAIDLVMSHLACADEPDHPHNRKQLTLFRDKAKILPSLPRSLCNSAGIFLGSDYHFDLLRPGIALYGGQPIIGRKNPMRPVVHLETRIAQIRMVPKGDGIGYGAAYQTRRKTRLATLPVGYADGYHRALGCTDKRKGASAFIGDFEAPLLGRVSMDLITIDITDIPPAQARTGTRVELLGTHVTIDDLATKAGTIGYEILTSLGTRYDVRHVGAE